MNKLQTEQELKQVAEEIAKSGDIFNNRQYILKQRISKFNKFSKNEAELSEIYDIVDKIAELSLRKEAVTNKMLHDLGFVSGKNFELFGTKYKIIDDKLHYRPINKDGSVSARGNMGRMNITDVEYASFI